MQGQPFRFWRKYYFYLFYYYYFLLWGEEEDYIFQWQSAAPSLSHPLQSCVTAETNTLLRLLTFSKEEILKIQWQSGGGGSYVLELAVS